MTKEEVQTKVFSILIDTGIAIEKFEDKLSDDLDSLDIVDLNMNLESEFNIIIPDIELEKWITYQDIVDYIFNELEKL